MRHQFLELPCQPVDTREMTLFGAQRDGKWVVLISSLLPSPALPWPLA